MAFVYINVHRGFEHVGDAWVSLGPAHDTQLRALAAMIYESNNHLPAARWHERSRRERPPMSNPISNVTTEPVDTIELEEVGP